MICLMVCLFLGAFRSICGGVPGADLSEGEGITYCDYGQESLICKPKTEMYQKGILTHRCCPEPPVNIA